jgi:hypothetical protein
VLASAHCPLPWTTGDLSARQLEQPGRGGWHCAGTTGGLPAQPAEGSLSPPLGPKGANPGHSLSPSPEPEGPRVFMEPPSSVQGTSPCSSPGPRPVLAAEELQSEGVLDSTWGAHSYCPPWTGILISSSFTCHLALAYPPVPLMDLTQV